MTTDSPVAAPGLREVAEALAAEHAAKRADFRAKRQPRTYLNGYMEGLEFALALLPRVAAIPASDAPEVGNDD